ncbi:hypothetical protein BC940DRAFT_294565 [Gongronella butleri]|nr:hypothetical protein BC940DRAFT_294565 [Gongronella butleri]
MPRSTAVLHIPSSKAANIVSYGLASKCTRKKATRVVKRTRFKVKDGSSNSNSIGCGKGSTMDKRVDLAYLRALQKDALAELHNHVQSYNDAFVAEMRRQEMRRHERVRRPSIPKQQENRDPATDELIDMLAAGSINDYSILIDWKQHHHQSYHDDETQGTLGDLW